MGNILKEMFSIYIMTEMIKCSRCYSKPLTDFDVNKNGVRFKMCNKCRLYDRERLVSNGEEIRE